MQICVKAFRNTFEKVTQKLMSFEKLSVANIW